ncbi:MAG: hypothetical protein AAF694_12300 [Bacteroidota bacterium]
MHQKSPELTSLTLPIIDLIHAETLTEFITFWSKKYAYGEEDDYKLVHKESLSKEELRTLYVWKNGMKLSNKKAKSFEAKILSKLDVINSLKAQTEVDLNGFRKEFDHISAVWQIFLLHIIHPKTYPIYDQHVHRAYRYMKGQSYQEINARMSKAKKLAFYFDEYLPFIESIWVSNLREMDKAFFAFGQFLNVGKNVVPFDSYEEG